MLHVENKSKVHYISAFRSETWFFFGLLFRQVFWCMHEKMAIANWIETSEKSYETTSIIICFLYFTCGPLFYACHRNKMLLNFFKFE